MRKFFLQSKEIEKKKVRALLELASRSLSGSLLVEESNSRALSVALFSTLIIFLFNSASVSVSSSKNQAHFYEWSRIK